MSTLLFGETLADKSWHDFAPYIWQPWTDSAIAEATGYSEVPIPNNKYGPEHVMAVAIAYTGAEGGGPFGDSAIRAMFDDANELGKIFKVPQSGLLEAEGPDGLTVKRALAEIAVQFAGDLAVQKATDTESKKGIFELVDGDTKLEADLGPQKWKATFNIGTGSDGVQRSGGQEKIVGIETLVTALIGQMVVDDSDRQDAIQDAALKIRAGSGGTDSRNITWLEAAATAACVTINEPMNAKPTKPGASGGSLHYPRRSLDRRGRCRVCGRRHGWRTSRALVEPRRSTVCFSWRVH